MKYPGISTCVAMAALTTLSCQPEQKPEPTMPEPEITIPFEAQYDIKELDFAEEWEEPAISKGTVTTITEASGLANSLTNPDYIWTHEDSGNDNLIYLLNKRKAQVVATYRLQNSTNVDWEDIAIGPGPVEGVTYLHLADIGDNNAVRTEVAVYRLPEPQYSPADSGKTIELTGVEKLPLVYPDSARDAEALLVDPISKDLFLVTKWEDRVRLYQLPYPHKTDTPDILKYIGSFPFTGIVAGDVSEDGRRVLLKSYSGIFYWKKEMDESLIHLLSKTPKRAPYNPVEFQGEAICWEGNSYYTLSEKLASFIPKLYYYKAK